MCLLISFAVPAAHESLSIQEDILRHQQQELHDIGQRVVEANSRIRDCDQAIMTHRRREAELRVQMQRAEDLAEKRQDELERDSVQDGRLEALSAGLKEAEEEKNILEGSYQEAIILKEKLNEIATKLNVEMRSFDEEIKDTNAKVGKLEAKASKLAQARAAALQERNQAIQRIEDAKADKQREEEKRRAQVDRVAQWTTQASQITPRVAVDLGETPKSLDKKLAKLSEELRRFEQR